VTLPMLPLGQVVFVTALQANILVYAVITDGSTPTLNTISLNVNGENAVAIVPGLQGNPGASGAPQFLLTQQDDIFSSPADLPGNLGPENFGEFWLLVTNDQNNNPIFTSAYVWWNTFYRVIPFGTVGPTGPFPVVTPQVVLLSPGLQSYVENTGTLSNPNWVFFLAVPEGPPGPKGAIAFCPDVNETTLPNPGQVLGFNGAYSEGLPVYQPMTVGALNPLPYIVPESAFSSYQGVAATTQLVATYTVPALPYAWKPVILGQVQITGFSIGLNPLLVGCEVLLGDATTGQLVGIGYGNAFGGAVTITPQTSTSANPNEAMTPQNSTALVQAGQSAEFFVNLVNSGMAGVYNFSGQNAQLLIFAIPATTEGAVAAAVYGSLTPKVTLSAFSVTAGTNGVSLLPVLSATARLSSGAQAAVTGKLSAHGQLTCSAVL
jgi:hypothetical protein